MIESIVIGFYTCFMILWLSILSLALTVEAIRTSRNKCAMVSAMLSDYFVLIFAILLAPDVILVYIPAVYCMVTVILLLYCIKRVGDDEI